MSIHHGDAIVSGAQEERPEQRPKCGWKVDLKDGSGKVIGEQKCGSEVRLFKVKGQGRTTGKPLETPVCSRHLEKAWKGWKVDSAEPM